MAACGREFLLFHDGSEGAGRQAPPGVKQDLLVKFDAEETGFAMQKTAGGFSPGIKNDGVPMQFETGFGVFLALPNARHPG